MKPKFIIYLFLFSFLANACKNGGANLSRNDSLSIAKQVVASKLLRPLSRFQKLGISNASNAFSRITDPGVLAAMKSCYKDNPLLNNPETNTNIQFIVLDSADWDSLIVLNKRKPIKSLYFYFGIKNYGAVATNNEDPVYNLITMPSFVATGTTDPNYAYDYGCPCPGSSCCPM